MENIQPLLGGFSTLSTFSNVGAAMMGTVLGLIVGAAPGIGSLADVALLSPPTYKLNPTMAVIMLGALYYPNMYDDTLSATLLDIPGDSPAICTAIDGYPMAAKKKRPGQALFTINMASFVGRTIGAIILTFTGPALANVGLKSGPSEMTALLFTAMTSISWLVGEDPIRGVVITILGAPLASTGMDTLSGSPRYDFGSMYLLGGIPFVPSIIGTVDFSQVINLVMEWGADAKANHDIKLTIKGSLLTKHDSRRLLPPAMRSGLTGASVGALPGAGATTGASMEYVAQKKLRSEEGLGIGVVEGITVAGVINNAAATGVFVPLLALGVSGNGVGTMLLGGLIMWGLSSGPLLFTNKPESIWSLIASLFLSSISTLIISISVILFLIGILSMPTKSVIPIIITVCMIGSYSPSYPIYGVIVIFLSGVLGYILTRSEFPTAPMLFFSVLAKLSESNIRKTFMISGGNLDIFFTRPVTCILMLIFLAFIFAPAIKAIIKKARLET